MAQTEARRPLAVAGDRKICCSPSPNGATVTWSPRWSRAVVDWR
ncbi:MAG: hypothetical protein U1F39_01790 [Steroidobacteraceae bacterium]